MAIFHSIWTVLLFLLFIGICAWAWSSRRKRDFAEAARIPFQGDPNKSAVDTGGEKKDG